ncbi:MAG: ADP-ribosylglycohydrolase family protein, partial [Muribaculaceae bacterium]|nr:ADP-ribosylglycohydrolase family protein [Muribaculaceae bacterium]
MTIDEKIKGALYGMALGDALGLGTEFMTRQEIKSYYPEGLTSFNQFIRDMHRSMHTPGSWTNDTEVILRILEPVIEDEGVDIVKIAHKLLEWYKEAPNDLEAPYRIVIPTEGWADNPIVISHRTWRSNKMLDASNEALNRALIIGIFADEETPISELARRVVNITHDDTRCVATTAVAAFYVNSYLYNDQEPDFTRMWDLC